MALRSRLLVYLLQPSVLSGFLCMSLAVALALGVSWSAMTDNVLVSGYLYGDYGLVTAFQGAPTGFLAFWRELFNHDVFRDVLTFGVLLLVAATVYIVLDRSNRVFNGAVGEWVDLHEARTPLRRQIRNQVLHRFWLRLATIMGWGVYTLMFLKLLMPFGIAAARYGMQSMGQMSGWVYLVTGCLVLATGLHFHVIFMRLAALRPRLLTDDMVSS